MSSSLSTEIEVKLKYMDYRKIETLELKLMEVRVFDLLEDIAL